MPGLVAMLSIAAALAGGGAPGAGATVRVDHGVAYGAAPDRQGVVHPLLMDVYRPPRPAPPRGRPAIVWIHGGGFTHGTRALVRPYARYFAARGYLAVSIDYRLARHDDLGAPGRPWPVRAAQHDAQAAVRFLRRHAARLHVDPRRIDVAGTSAGAITALNVALHPDDPGHSGSPGFSSRVRAAVAVAGFAPLRAVPHRAPPLLILQGTADEIVPFGWGQRTCRLVGRGGGRCDLVPIPGAGHGMIWTQTLPLARRAADWLRSAG